MKKIVILLISLFCFISPVFAGNLMQQEYETAKMQELAQEPAFYNMSKRGVIEDDYYGYLNGKDSLYGVILYKKDELEKVTTPDKSIDLRYINLVLQKYDFIIKNKNPQLLAPDKIIVDDEDYKNINKDVKDIISGFNLFMAK